MAAIHSEGRNGGDVQQRRSLPSEGNPSGEAGKFPVVSDVDVPRAGLYGLLARVLGAPMSDETLEIVRGLGSEYTGTDTDLGQALALLGAMAGRTSRTGAEEEYTLLFFGMGAGGEMHPYASQYLTGFVYEKPLAKLRHDMDAIGVAASGTSSEPEDHIAYLCEIMHGLITGAFGEPATLADQQKFYETHMASWAGQFFTDLEGAEAAALYTPVGTIGRLFLAIEAEAFEMAA
ncbi:MAG: molecular chaperone TorD family protein [Proteobacteria bacterium]|nr:molecular chaperone TorD family protein [Pseudomonadota bacterium]